MTHLRLGICPWIQATDWPGLLETARRVDRLGYDHLWCWDHLYAIYGDPYQPIFEGWTTLGAWAVATEHVRLGLLVGANTFRNPGIVAKSAATLDHASGGRAIVGLGGAWFGLEHEAHGLDFGSGFGQRLDWLDEATGIVRALLDGREVTHHGERYRFEAARHQPPPLQRHLPIMIGGSGEKKTLRTVARYADLWNAFGTPDELRHKVEVLGEHCVAVGRDPATIERTLGCKLVIRDSESAARQVWDAALTHNRTPLDIDEEPWLGPPEAIAERLRAYAETGFQTLIVELPAPYDVETLERLIGEVKPLVEAP
ncbi:MAG TPA: LLM class flavin-dependent oxidoreductase [Candidatus Limnocylindrales bacterium]